MALVGAAKEAYYFYMEQYYRELIPAYKQGLMVLSTLVTKADRHARKEKFPVENLLNARLAPDMLTLIGQVQYAYFTIIESLEHMSGRKPPEMGYDEKNVADLQKSIKKVLSYAKRIKPKDFERSKESVVETYLDPGKRISKGTYVHLAALPNFYFHLATAYDILRHNGVRIGKDDYIGKLPRRLT